MTLVFPGLYLDAAESMVLQYLPLVKAMWCLIPACSVMEHARVVQGTFWNRKGQKCLLHFLEKDNANLFVQ